MRKYKNQQAKQLEQVSCNMCGRELKVENGIVMEGVFPVDIVWGYFSSRDGERHSFDLCESCYERWTAGFKIPVAKGQEKELI
ncbi:hypothetical protein [Lactonifactor longoviformis]|uniref:hypothetical protein n=1 Tax=Lactonifactor longoviformis TaxID=341220 RepID=UPI0036F2127C